MKYIDWPFTSFRNVIEVAADLRDKIMLTESSAFQYFGNWTRLFKILISALYTWIILSLF